MNALTSCQITGPKTKRIDACTVSATTARRMQRALLSWFKANGRQFPWRKPRVTLFQAIIAEVLLQRTQAETVAKFFPAFLARFPNWCSLANVSPDNIGEIIKPIGLWRRRSASLSSLALVMAARRGKFPRSRQDIEQLPGVGQYIANSILLFSQKRPEPLLDVNMARVLERVFGPRRLADIRYDSQLQATARILVGGEDPIALNWAILDLASKVCIRRLPRCNECPLKKWCRYLKS
jgi:A/G-specific adenine glycosylase